MVERTIPKMKKAIEILQENIEDLKLELQWIIEHNKNDEYKELIVESSNEIKSLEKAIKHLKKNEN